MTSSAAPPATVESATPPAARMPPSANPSPRAASIRAVTAQDAATNDGPRWNTVSALSRATAVQTASISAGPTVQRTTRPAVDSAAAIFTLRGHFGQRRTHRVHTGTDHRPGADDDRRDGLVTAGDNADHTGGVTVGPDVDLPDLDGEAAQLPAQRRTERASGTGVDGHHRLRNCHVRVPHQGRERVSGN